MNNKQSIVKLLCTISWIVMHFTIIFPVTMLYFCGKERVADYSYMLFDLLCVIGLLIFIQMDSLNHCEN